MLLVCVFFIKDTGFLLDDTKCVHVYWKGQEWQRRWGRWDVNLRTWKQKKFQKENILQTIAILVVGCCNNGPQCVASPSIFWPFPLTQSLGCIMWLALVLGRFEKCLWIKTSRFVGNCYPVNKPGLVCWEMRDSEHSCSLSPWLKANPPWKQDYTMAVVQSLNPMDCSTPGLQPHNGPASKCRCFWKPR